MTLFSTAYFPSISYMTRFLAESAPLIEVYDTYHKQTYRNRCRIMTANGVEVMSIPVVKVNGNHTMTRDVRLSPIEPWQHIHSRCLESAYKASPYFDHYYEYLRPIFETHYERLIEVNDAALRAVLRMLKVDKEIVHTADYAHEAENDLREAFSHKRPNNSVPEYYQVFSNKFAFAPDLSILDLIFNEGPSAKEVMFNC